MSSFCMSILPSASANSQKLKYFVKYISTKDPIRVKSASRVDFCNQSASDIEPSDHVWGPVWSSIILVTAPESRWVPRKHEILSFSYTILASLDNFLHWGKSNACKRSRYYEKLWRAYHILQDTRGRQREKFRESGLRIEHIEQHSHHFPPLFASPIKKFDLFASRSTSAAGRLTMK